MGFKPGQYIDGEEHNYPFVLCMDIIVLPSLSLA